MTELEKELEKQIELLNEALEFAIYILNGIESQYNMPLTKKDSMLIAGKNLLKVKEGANNGI